MSSRILKTVLHRRKDNSVITGLPHFTVLQKWKMLLACLLAVVWQGGQCQLITGTDITNLYFLLQACYLLCA